MPRLTPQQLHEARKRRQEERLQEEQRRQEERQQREREDAEKMARDRQRKQQYDVLRSSVDALYVEMDKLTKKAPKEQISSMNLQMMNELVVDTRKLIPDDAQLQRVTPFEAAGDNPEYRDALLIISQVQAALERFRKKHSREWLTLDI
jgi:hypothetical protein